MFLFAQKYTNLSFKNILSVILFEVLPVKKLRKNLDKLID